MVQDVSKGERFLTITLLKDSPEPESKSQPRIHSIGTLSYLVNDKEMENGNRLIMVVGIKKVLINEADQSTHPYRIGMMTILNEINQFSQEEEQRNRLLSKFTRLLHLSGADTQLDVLKKKMLDLEMLTNIICSVFPVEKQEQQKLLELPDVALRLDVVCQFMDSELSSEKSSELDEYELVIPDPSDWN